MEWEFLYTGGHITATKLASDDELLAVGRALEHLISMGKNGANVGVAVAQHKMAANSAAIFGMWPKCGGPYEISSGGPASPAIPQISPRTKPVKRRIRIDLTPFDQLSAHLRLIRPLRYEALIGR
jgi:hypothetical protein